MNLRNMVILGIVVLAIGLVLWLKPSKPDVVNPGQEVTEAVGSETTVLLFADPDEAESSCGCAEIIRLARSAGEADGVSLNEIDVTKSSETARRHKVRVSPTVIIMNQNGAERTRFEGESLAVIEELRGALATLRRDEPPARDDGGK